MTKKRVLLLLVFFVFSLTSCKKLEDYLPEEYGTDNGHFLYSGNIKMTSSGDNINYILKEIVIDEVTYQLENYSFNLNEFNFIVNQVYYYEDDIFYIIKTLNNLYLVKYNFDDLNVEVIKCLNEFDEKTNIIMGLGNNLILDSSNWVYELNYEGEVIDKIALAGHRISFFESEYVVVYNNEEIYFKSKTNNFNKIHEIINPGKYINIRDLSNNYFSFTENIDENMIYFIYDIDLNKIKFINDNSSGKEVYILDENYYISYDKFKRKYKNNYRYYTKNNVLYKYINDEEKEETYKFSPKKDFMNDYYFADNKFYFIRKNSGVLKLRNREGYFDLETKTLKYEKRPQHKLSYIYEDNSYKFHSVIRTIGLMGPEYYFFLQD